MTLTIHKYNKDIVWVDLVSPTREEVTHIMDHYRVHPIVAEELLINTRKPHIDPYAEHIYLVLHFPALKHSHSEQTVQEIDFIIGKKFLITTRYDSVDAIDQFSRVLETGNILHKNEDTHAGFLFYYLIKKLYHSLEDELDYIESALEDIESHIFEGKEKEMIYEISLRGRDLTDFKKALGYHREVLESLEIAGQSFFDKSFVFYLHRILGEYKRINHQLTGEQIFFNEIRETNNSLLTTKQNEVMKTLTIISFMTLPLSLFVGIFGMNASHMPIVDHQQGFWIIIAMLLALIVILIGFFKKKKWL